MQINKILIIPMCGVGKRFSDAGYEEHKSMLNINKANMLERVINKFKNIDVFLITSKKIHQHLESNLGWKKIKQRVNVIIINDHKLGPAYSIFKAFDYLPKGVRTYISYCDITWQWDNEHLIKENTEAAIFCHYGFHPHLVNNNFSAFCKPDSLNKSKLLQIKEKESFTNNWMDEPLSIGLFYIRDLELLKIPLYEMITKNHKVANEFFPSLLFNYIQQSGVEVSLIPVKSFVHYGTPLQFDDINSWTDYFKNSFESNNSLIKKIKKYDASIMISGTGSRMKTISKAPKHLLKAGNITLIEHVIKSLPINNDRITLISNNQKGILSQKQKPNIFQISKTNSQYESLKLAAEHLYHQKKFFLCSCDCFGFFDNEKFDFLATSNSTEVILFGFKPSLLQLKISSSFSTFSYKNEEVKKIFIKSIPDDDFYGLAGFFWFKRGDILSKAINEFSQNFPNINREVIIDDVLEYLRDQGEKIAFISLNKYIHLGTPEEYNEYKYWNSCIPYLIN